MVPGTQARARLGNKKFLIGYGFLLLSHDPWEWGSLRIRKLCNSQHPLFSTDFDTGHGTMISSGMITVNRVHYAGHGMFPYSSNCDGYNDAESRENAIC